MSQNVAEFNKSFYITTLRLAFSSKLQHVKFCKYLLQLILNSINTKLYLFYLQGNNHIVYYIYNFANTMNATSNIMNGKSPVMNVLVITTLQLQKKRSIKSFLGAARSKKWNQPLDNFHFDCQLDIVALH